MQGGDAVMSKNRLARIQSIVLDLLQSITDARKMIYIYTAGLLRL